MANATVQSDPCWSVIEFAKGGPRTVYIGRDFEKSRDQYNALENGMWTECHGRDENCQPIPGVVGNNIKLGRKLHGIERL